MQTSYQDIYDTFLGKITDHEFLQLPDVDIEDFCFKYLKSSLTKFKKCKQDLSNRDDTLKVFYLELTDKEVEIIATLMLVSWLTPQVLSKMNTKQNLIDSEFKKYSQANHLAQLEKVRQVFIDEADGFIIEYTYETGDLEDLK